MTVIIIASIVFIALVAMSVKYTLDNRVKPLESDSKLEEYYRAVAARDQAEVNFQIVDPEYTDVAIADLQAAELRMNLALHRLREGRCQEHAATGNIGESCNGM